MASEEKQKANTVMSADSKVQRLFLRDAFHALLLGGVLTIIWAFGGVWYFWPAWAFFGMFVGFCFRFSVMGMWPMWGKIQERVSHVLGDVEEAQIRRLSFLLPGFQKIPSARKAASKKADALLPKSSAPKVDAKKKTQVPLKKKTSVKKTPQSPKKS